MNFAGQMKKTIYNKFDKTKIASLPRVLFGGRIVVVCTEREAEKAVNYLMSQKILGVDTETRPSFKKGLMHPVSLLQVSSHEVCAIRQTTVGRHEGPQDRPFASRRPQLASQAGRFPERLFH